jgi:hypothetical protein
VLRILQPTWPIKLWDNAEICKLAVCLHLQCINTAADKALQLGAQ